MDLMKAFTEKYTKAEPPKVSIGDTVRVHLRVKEGNRERIQVFEKIACNWEKAVIYCIGLNNGRSSAATLNRNRAGMNAYTTGGKQNGSHEGFY